MLRWEFFPPGLFFSFWDDTKHGARSRDYGDRQRSEQLARCIYTGAVIGERHGAGHGLSTETSKTKGLRLSGHGQSQAGFDQAASSSYVTAAGLRASGTGERPPSA